MTNFEKWRLFTDGLMSPDNYIDWSYYYLISAALQRRVWLPPEHSPIFPNMYVVFVGDPSVGKGLPLKQIAAILKHFKMPDPAERAAAQDKKLTPAENAVVTELQKADYTAAVENQNRYNSAKSKDSKSFDRPLMLPVAADATTWEALVRSIAKAVRHINYPKWDDKLQKNVLGIYTHSSICFCLEEISSLFRRKAEEVSRFLLNTYDCGDYDYDTKTQGSDSIKRCCVSLIGGTTPAFMQECLNDRLLSEGFSSRTFFIFATQNRKVHFFIPGLLPEQEAARQNIIQHVEKLTRLYGPVQISPDIRDFLQKWVEKHQYQRPNPNPKLDVYYGRKNLHVAKLAMAIHFGESCEMEMTIEPFKKAIDILAEEEKKMHYALGMDNSNPLAIPARKVLKFIENCGKKSKKELLAEFWELLPNGAPDIDEILEHLKGMGKIKSMQEDNPITHAPVTYFTTIKVESNGGNVKAPY